MRIVFKTNYMQDIRPWKDGYQLSLYLILLAVVFAAPFFMDAFYLGEMTNVLIWAIAGLGLMILTGHTGQASLGHAAFLAMGCYANIILLDAGVPFMIAFPLAGILTGIIGMVIAIPALRLHGIYLAIATMAMSILVDDIIVLTEPWTGGVGGKYAPPVNVFGFMVDRWGTPREFYYLVLVVSVIVTLGYINLLRAPLGRSFIALRDSEVSAQAMGIDVARTKAISFAISCGITGLAGALMGLFAGAFNNETFSVVISIQLLMMIVIGGLGSIHGAFFGAIIVGFLPQFLSIAKEWVGAIAGGSSVAIPGLEFGIFGMILIIFILFEPMGIYGRWFKIRTWFELFPFYRKDMFKRQKSYLKTERLR
ncbi:branched-chain amino acid ABC transporter permease [Shimia thalassica]|uniref:branched-chain amino acid ABC transporter permease n=1 Tax=Shimia thalassica TaxID=1715693 RepID=UPI000C06A75D|nr:branched-chain amino acid ABC transporter permease [Shimia thalassica]PHO06012.1 branched-chain amino acid ABC transporter permease [Rhodobacteraceae bacterium 4F10]MBU2941363.1 branched-chain amino acid ABC transporter permease [Shimia thalassica]MDO6481533.1 branched-chain amino acid ABC transporter permease [Shimia thalassica]MDO6503152.1 branched-chain amino acid ABC transporter permease [Shimia thalassica]MDO6522640.1 branched-chain amino acid ABC transporter permease [Shimia thalassic